MAGVLSSLHHRQEAHVQELVCDWLADHQLCHQFQVVFEKLFKNSLNVKRL